MIRDIRLRAAGSAESEAISRVLQTCGLPHDEIERPSSLFHIATMGEKVVGCAYGVQHGRTFAIHAAAVLPECRGHRVATYLISTLLMRARAHGCIKATVLNPEQPGFFARCGFTLTPADSVAHELHLSRETLRRFGIGTHYMCRHLD